MIKDLTKETIDQLTEKSKTSNDLILSLYKEVIPLWDHLPEGLIGNQVKFPIVSKETWKYICDKLIVLTPGETGFLWINKGFSRDENMADWVVCVDDRLINQ